MLRQPGRRGTRARKNILMPVQKIFQAKGNFHPGSDIDLSIVSKQLTSSQISRIETELDDLLLPYKIDLSERCKLQNTDLLDHIERVGKTFFNKQEKS